MTTKEVLAQYTKEVTELKKFLSKELSDIKMILNGNGAPEIGLVFRLVQMEKHIKEFTPKSKKADSLTKWFMRGSIGSLVVERIVTALVT